MSGSLNKPLLAARWGYRLYLAVRDRKVDEVISASEGIQDRFDRDKLDEDDYKFFSEVIGLVTTGEWEEAERRLIAVSCDRAE